MKKILIMLFVLIVAVSSAFASVEFDKSNLNIDVKMLVGFQYGVSYETGKWRFCFENVSVNPLVGLLVDNLAETETEFNRSLYPMGVHCYTMYTWHTWREWVFSVGLGAGYFAKTGSIFEMFKEMVNLDGNGTPIYDGEPFVTAEFETAYYVSNNHAITAKFVLPITPSTIEYIKRIKNPENYSVEDQGTALIFGGMNLLCDAAILSSIGWRYSY